jgi:hypothetical protein
MNLSRRRDGSRIRAPQDPATKRISVSGGTEGSNPVPSSGESGSHSDLALQVENARRQDR